MTFLSAYSGLGAHDLGFERAGWRCVGQIEWEPFCQAILKKHWPHVPKWMDVCDVTVDDVRRTCGRIDCITGGFSCQDVSVAGRGAGLAKTTRSGLTWRNLFRLIRGIRPLFLCIENVPALRGRGIDRVLCVLERIGYACRSFVAGAEHVGAPHRRHRVWIVGKLADAGRECVSGRGISANMAGTARTVEADGEQRQRMRHTAGDVGATLADPQRDGGREQEPGRGAEVGVAAGGTGEKCDGLHNATHSRQSNNSANCAQNFAGLAYSDQRRFGTRREATSDGNAPEISHIDQQGENAGDGLAIPSEPGLAERRKRAISTRTQLAMPSGFRGWPARPGETQHEWEQPRLIKFGLGRAVARTTCGLDDAARRDAERTARYQNKEALKAMGNCNPPQVAYVVARSIMEAARPIHRRRRRRKMPGQYTEGA